MRESDVQGLNMESITDAMDGHLDNSTGNSFNNNFMGRSLSLCLLSVLQGCIINLSVLNSSGKIFCPCYISWKCTISGILCLLT